MIKDNWSIFMHSLYKRNLGAPMLACVRGEDKINYVADNFIKKCLVGNTKYRPSLEDMQLWLSTRDKSKIDKIQDIHTNSKPWHYQIFIKN